MTHPPSNSTPPDASAVPSEKANWTPRHRFTVGRVIVGLLVLLLLALIVFGIGLYRGTWSRASANRIVAFVPYPVARIEWHLIPFRSFAETLATLQHFYTQQAPPSGRPDDAFLTKTVLTKLVRDSVLEERARRANVAVSAEEIDAEYARIAEQSGGAAVAEQNIRDLYDWSPVEFKAQVVRPFLLRQKMQDHLTTDPAFDASSRTRAEAVLDKAKAGDDFAALARQYSEDTTAANGGDLGFFGPGDMVPEFQTAVEQLKPGEVSGLVRTQYGYHIIKLEEKVSDGGERWHARHILLKAADVDAWLSNELRNVPVVVFLAGFRWDGACASVLADGESCPTG